LDTSWVYSFRHPPRVLDTRGLAYAFYAFDGRLDALRGELLQKLVEHWAALIAPVAHHLDVQLAMLIDQ
jgi:hypothetical protein